MNFDVFRRMREAGLRILSLSDPSDRAGSEDRSLDRVFGLRDRLRPPDMQPQPVEAQAEQAPPFGGAEEERREAEHVLADVSNSSGFKMPTPV